MSVDHLAPSAGAMNQAMEERFLFLLLLLRQPRLRMVYVTSMPINEHIIEYYLSLLPGVIPSHARARLDLVSVGDSSPTAADRQAAGPPPGPVPHRLPRAGPGKARTSSRTRARRASVTWR